MPDTPDTTPEGPTPISDERLAILRDPDQRTGGWPSDSAECYALIARLDAAEATLEQALAERDALREALVECSVEACQAIDHSGEEESACFGNLVHISRIAASALAAGTKDGEG